jgi:DNA-binding NarL/FixJ family response regulator
MSAELHFTERQKEVIRLIAVGFTAQEMGTFLGISERTAKAHCDVVRRKCGCYWRREVPIVYMILTGDNPFPQPHTTWLDRYLEYSSNSQN